MAIAYDTSTKATGNTVSSLTFAHTCTGSDRILFVAISSTQTISTVTYNGVNLTSIGNILDATAGVRTYLWYLIAPATGSNNVIVTPSTTAIFSAIASSYTGVAQSGQPDNSGTQGRTVTTSYSQSVTTVADNCWVVMGGYAANAATLTAGSNTVVRQQDVAVIGGFLLDSGVSKTPAGSATLAVTSASQAFSSVIASFKPSVLASSKLALLGVG